MEYISTATRDWVSSAFLRMSDREFADELVALKASRDNYLQGSEDLVNSFIHEYLDTLYDIARDVLMFRFVETCAERKVTNNRNVAHM